MDSDEVITIPWVPRRTVTLRAVGSQTVELVDRDLVIDVGSTTTVTFQAIIWAHHNGASLDLSTLQIMLDGAVSPSDSIFGVQDVGDADIYMDVKPASSTQDCPYTASKVIPETWASYPPVRYYRHRLQAACSATLDVTLSYELFALAHEP